MNNPMNNNMNQQMNNNNINNDMNNNMNQQIKSNNNIPINNQMNNNINNDLNNQINNNMNNNINNMNNQMNSNFNNNNINNNQNLFNNNNNINNQNPNDLSNFIINKNLNNNGQNNNGQNNFNNVLNANGNGSIPSNNDISVIQNNQPNQQVCTDPNSFARFTKATDTGLSEIGESSYLNAVLQLLGSIRPLASYFLKQTNFDFFMNNVKNAPLSFVTFRLYHHLYHFPEKKEKETYSPESFKKVLSMKNYVYKSDKRRNPNDLLCFILSTLHNELNRKKNMNVIKPNIQDKNNVITCGINNFQNSNNSMISNVFNWFEIKESKCSQCSFSIYSFQTYNTLDLDINSCSTIFKNNPYLTIYNCLDYLISQKLSKSFCKNCNKYMQMINMSKIYSSPNYFMFLLNRGNMEQNLLNINFKIEEKINLRKYIEFQNAPTNYQLTGIVSIESQSQKYVSFCKSPVDKEWYFYNNEIIQKVDLNYVLNVHYNINYIPSILCYKLST